MKNKYKTIIRYIIKKSEFLTLLNVYRLKRLNQINNIKFKKMDRTETFEYIYKNHSWGGKGYYSGVGSYETAYIEPYCKLLRDFIKEHNITQICDLGCGDFQVAARWVTEEFHYEGVDIVKEMIDSHNIMYGSDRVHFSCLDIVDDPLPEASLCVIRQVLQHLSNEEIMKILTKLKQYQFVIVTEHVVNKTYASSYNMEKMHGSHTRVSLKSGVYLDEEPFHLKISLLMSTPYCSNASRHEEINTYLLCNENK